MKLKSIMQDPRDYQIMVLSSMLIYGLFWLGFPLQWQWISGILAVALLSQFGATRLWKIKRFEWRSALISGLSLCLLMRSPSLGLSLVLAMIAIVSKFVIRWNGKHIFNPTNLALALGILFTDQVAINPGQWGNGAGLAFFILCMGIFVANKACRSDVSFAFLLVYGLLLISYTVVNGGELENALVRLRTGSLLIFTFFMISDPKSTPDSKWGRYLFGSAVAVFGLFIQLKLKIPAGLIISLASFSILTPFIDSILPGTKFQWSRHSESVPIAT